MSFYQMLLRISQNHSAMIADVIPLNKEGMRIVSIYGCTVDQLATAITPDLTSADWIVTARDYNKNNVLVEPEVTRPILWAESSFYYHVSDRINQQSILQHGIQPRTGGNTAMQRQYPPRIFLARDLVAAIGFVTYQCKSPLMPANLPSITTSKNKSDLDIWRVEHDGTPIYADVLFPEVACWIENPIPINRILLVDWWEGFECIWKMQRVAGIV